MNICNLDKILCDVPPKWKEGIIKALHYVYNDECEGNSCDRIKECQTLTNLSPFSIIEGTKISVDYKNERYLYSRSFDVVPLISSSLDSINPSCLATEEEWADMTFVERLQLLISAQCACVCPATTTTITSSTTTTTTIAPTTTTSTSTTSSTSSSTTTTTTSHPFADFIVSNPQVHGSIVSVTPSFYSITTGSFPIGQTEEVIGTHGGFSGVISFTISGFVFGTFYVHLLKDGVEIDCVPCSSNGTFAFSSHTFLNTEEMRIIMVLNPC